MPKTEMPKLLKNVKIVNSSVIVQNVPENHKNSTDVYNLKLCLQCQIVENTVNQNIGTAKNSENLIENENVDNR